MLSGLNLLSFFHALSGQELHGKVFRRVSVARASMQDLVFIILGVSFQGTLLPSSGSAILIFQFSKLSMYTQLLFFQLQHQCNLLLGSSNQESGTYYYFVSIFLRCFLQLCGNDAAFVQLVILSIFYQFKTNFREIKKFSLQQF